MKFWFYKLSCHKDHESVPNDHPKFRRSDTVRVVGTYNPSGTEKECSWICMSNRYVNILYL